ncbi:MAG: hypothetical protein ACRBK7_07445 [Acidimicrobiales bacterium]
MQVPIRLVSLIRPSVPPGVLLAVGFSAVVLGSTPFLLDLVVAEYGISLIWASMIGVAQLSGFVVGSWGSGRWLQPRRRVFVASLCVAMVANLISTLLPPFAILVALRFISGLALGLLTWFGWVQVFGEEKGMGDIAVMGPITGIVSAPLIATFAIGGATQVFMLLAVLAVVPLLFNQGTGANKTIPKKSSRSKPIPEATAILVALGMFTLGGSSVFQFAVVLGTGRPALSVGTIALVFSANAIAGIPGAKWPWSRGMPGAWMAITGCCAIIMANATSGPLFAAIVILWGFAFWMGIPGVFSVLAKRSANPADRAGDAQAVMASGRIFGPLIGAVVLEALGERALGLAGGGLMISAGAIVLALQLRAPEQPTSLAGSGA